MKRGVRDGAGTAGGRRHKTMRMTEDTEWREIMRKYEDESWRAREHVRRIAGTDAGRVVLISSQHFIPVILHGRKQGRKREGMRDVKEGRVNGRNLPVLPQHSAAPCCMSASLSLPPASLCI